MASTKSFVNPSKSAPANPWVHWLVFNIPPTTRSVDEGERPEGGIDGLANGGTRGYEGPCPPSGKHRYMFILTALDSKLDLSAYVDRMDVLTAMENSILAQAILVGTYEKNKN